MIDTESKPDTSDLDLLDDEHRHAYCILCNPDVRPLAVAIALCGARFTFRRDGTNRIIDPPPNACPECLRLWAVEGLCEHS